MIYDQVNVIQDFIAIVIIVPVLFSNVSKFKVAVPKPSTDLFGVHSKSVMERMYFPVRQEHDPSYLPLVLRLLLSFLMGHKQVLVVHDSILFYSFYVPMPYLLITLLYTCLHTRRLIVTITVIIAPMIININTVFPV